MQAKKQQVVDPDGDSDQNDSQQTPGLFGGWFGSTAQPEGRENSDSDNPDDSSNDEPQPEEQTPQDDGNKFKLDMHLFSKDPGMTRQQKVIQEAKEDQNCLLF